MRKIKRTLYISPDYCPKDYKNRHCFQMVGVDNGYIVYRCSQCHKCRKEKIKWIDTRKLKFV